MTQVCQEYAHAAPSRLLAFQTNSSNPYADAWRQSADTSTRPKAGGNAVARLGQVPTNTFSISGPPEPFFDSTRHNEAHQATVTALSHAAAVTFRGDGSTNPFLGTPSHLVSELAPNSLPSTAYHPSGHPLARGLADDLVEFDTRLAAQAGHGQSGSDAAIDAGVRKVVSQISIRDDHPRRPWEQGSLVPPSTGSTLSQRSRDPFAPTARDANSRLQGLQAAYSGANSPLGQLPAHYLNERAKSQALQQELDALRAAAERSEEESRATIQLLRRENACADDIIRSQDDIISDCKLWHGVSAVEDRERGWTQMAEDYERPDAVDKGERIMSHRQNERLEQENRRLESLLFNHSADQEPSRTQAQNELTRGQVLRGDYGSIFPRRPSTNHASSGHRPGSSSVLSFEGSVDRRQRFPAPQTQVHRAPAPAPALQINRAHSHLDGDGGTVDESGSEMDDGELSVEQGISADGRTLTTVRGIRNRRGEFILSVGPGGPTITRTDSSFA